MGDVKEMEVVSVNNECLRKYCRFNGSGRGCRFGAECYYSHEKVIVVDCRFYGTIRGCRFGNACYFRHPEQQQQQDKFKEMADTITELKAKALAAASMAAKDCNAKDKISERERSKCASLKLLNGNLERELQRERDMVAQIATKFDELKIFMSAKFEGLVAKLDDFARGKAQESQLVGMEQAVTLNLDEEIKDEVKDMDVKEATLIDVEMAKGHEAAAVGLLVPKEEVEAAIEEEHKGGDAADMDVYQEEEVKDMDQEVKATLMELGVEEVLYVNEEDVGSSSSEYFAQCEN